MIIIINLKIRIKIVFIEVKINKCLFFISQPSQKQTLSPKNYYYN